MDGIISLLNQDSKTFLRLFGRCSENSFFFFRHVCFMSTGISNIPTTYCFVILFSRAFAMSLSLLAERALGRLFTAATVSLGDRKVISKEDLSKTLHDLLLRQGNSTRTSKARVRTAWQQAWGITLNTILRTAPVRTTDV